MMTHREATSADRDHLWEFMVDALGGQADEALAFLGINVEQFAALYRTTGTVRVVQEEQVDVGYLWIEVRAQTLHIHAIMVLPSIRGRGVGTRVIRGLQEEFSTSVDAIEIGVQDENRRAVTFYERLGFERQPVASAPGFSIYRLRL